jgi:hypothetical protein
MPLKDVIDTTPKPCKVARIIEDLDADDKATLDKWLTTMRPWPLSQALTKYGKAVSEQTMKRHQVRSCSCYVVAE